MSVGLAFILTFLEHSILTFLHTLLIFPNNTKPSVFNSVETFDEWFNKPFAQFGSGNNAAATVADEEDTESDVLNNEERMLIIHRLHELLRPFMLRRIKSEVLDQLPDKVEKVLRCELSSWQKALYKQISVSATEDGDKTSSRGLNNIVMQLRKVANHPYLFAPDGYFVNDYIFRTSGKVELLERMLPKLKAGGHRILMFFQMTAVMTIMEDYFAYRGYSCLRLDGSTPADEREKRMGLFNAPDSDCFIFLLSTRAGGLGLNLATADTVVIFDSDWNPMMDLQAQDRAHRIGQKKIVTVFRLITNSPVEEKILNRATEKLNMSELVVEAGKFDKSSVEHDNSQERLKMMEVLLTDFDTMANQSISTSLHSTTGSLPSSEADDEEGDEDASDDGSEEGNIFNELISTNQEDYEIYCKIDAELQEAARREGRDIKANALIVDPDEIPDWIRFPNGKKKTTGDTLTPAEGDDDSAVLGKRRTNNRVVTYDDGLTERQFVRIMENHAEEEEKLEKARKRERKSSVKQIESTESDFAVLKDFVSEKKNASRKRKVNSTVPEDKSLPENEILYGEERTALHENADSTPQELPEEMIKKLINITKGIIYLKDKATKRKLSDIFLEKPCKVTYPDYYNVIDCPIGMNDILRKVRGKGYSTLSEYFHDWQTLFNNAKAYNEDDSWVVIDAGTLEAELDRLLEKNSLLEKKAKPLRIKLSLKGIRSKSSSEKVSSKSNKSSSPSSHKKKKKKSKRYDDTSLEDTAIIDYGVEPLNSDSFDGAINIKSSSVAQSSEGSPHSNIVGFENRVATSKKRGKIRSGGRGSRGGRGAYKKNDG